MHYLGVLWLHTIVMSLSAKQLGCVYFTKEKDKTIIVKKDIIILWSLCCAKKKKKKNLFDGNLPPVAA